MVQPRKIHSLLHRCLLLLALGCALPLRAETAAPLQVVTADFPPFAVDGQPEHPGLEVELVQQMLQRVGQPATVAFYPWVRALAMTASQPRVAVLPLTRTPEREAHYQWLVKLGQQHFVFINRRTSAPVTTLEQARKLKLVVLRGSPNLAQLLSRQFGENQVAQVTRVDDMVRMLDRGMVDAIYGGDAINMENIRLSGRNPADYQVGMTVESADIWLGGGKGFSEAERQTWQQAYDAMVKDGTVARLYRSYQVRLPQ